MTTVTLVGTRNSAVLGVTGVYNKKKPGLFSVWSNKQLAPDSICLRVKMLRWNSWIPNDDVSSLPPVSCYSRSPMWLMCCQLLTQVPEKLQGMTICKPYVYMLVKLIEAIITNRLRGHMSRKSQISVFCKVKFCLSKLTQYFEYLKKKTTKTNMWKQQSSQRSLCGFSKGFKQVLHQRLLKKLITHGKIEVSAWQHNRLKDITRN